MTGIERLHASLRRLPPGERRSIYILLHPKAWAYGFAGLNRNFVPGGRHVFVGAYTRDIALGDLVEDVESVVAEAAQRR